MEISHGRGRIRRFLEQIYRYHLQHQTLIDDAYKQIKSPVEKKLTDHLIFKAPVKFSNFLIKTLRGPLT